MPNYTRNIPVGYALNYANLRENGCQIVKLASDSFPFLLPGLNIIKCSL